MWATPKGLAAAAGPPSLLSRRRCCLAVRHGGRFAACLNRRRDHPEYFNLVQQPPSCCFPQPPSLPCKMNLVQLVSAVLACLSLVQARPCTLSQLTGSNGNFAITGGPDLSTPIQTGTTQIISFNWAVGCPVKAINSILVIPASQAAANGTTLDTTPSSVSFGRGLTHDLAAFLSTSIPATVPSGRYTFRAILSTTTGPCSIDSTPFQVLSVSPPGPLPTGPVPDPNSINCPENADDHNPSPGSPCSYKGIVVCSPSHPNQFYICNQDSHGCPVFTTPFSCGVGLECSADSGPVGCQ